MSIARTDDRAASRDSIIGGIAAGATIIAAAGAALLSLRRRRERPPSELPLSAHLRRDIGLPPIEPTSHIWREG